MKSLTTSSLVVANVIVLILHSSAGVSTPRLFDHLISRQLIGSSCETKVVPAYRIIQESAIRTYIARYRLPGMHADDHYDLAISVGPPGTFLTAAQFQQRYSRFREKYADRGPAFLASEFPAIGARAQREVLSVGPGGSAYGLVFTTYDERYDIRAVLRMSLSEGVLDPDCDIEGLARRVEARYKNRK